MNQSTSNLTTLMQYYPQVETQRALIDDRLRKCGTPLLLADRGILANRYQAIDQSLQENWGPHIIGQSFKTNYLVAKSHFFQELGAWAEVVSAREYHMARSLQYPGNRIIVNGPHKPDDLLVRATADGALIHVNDHDELDRLLSLSASHSGRLNIGLRVSSTLPGLGHSRFGFSLENDEASGAVEKIGRAENVELVSLHTHLYGDTDDPQVYALAAERAARFAQQRIPHFERSLKFFDIGGGYPAHTPCPKSRKNWNPQPIDAYIRAIAQVLTPLFRDMSPAPTLIVEPGRYLMGDAIMLVTRVVHVKSRDGKQVINSDGSISMVPLTHYAPQIIHPFSEQLEQRRSNELPTVLYGATCRENDVLYDGPFPTVCRGDYLFCFAAGAYNSSLSPNFIFDAPTMELI